MLACVYQGVQVSVPELHLHQAELSEVCAQLKGPEDGVLLGQHDQRGAGQAPVDVQSKPAARTGSVSVGTDMHARAGTEHTRTHTQTQRERERNGQTREEDD